MDHPSFAEHGIAPPKCDAYSAIVYQATGMMSVQTLRSVDGALSLLQRYASSVGRCVEAVARDVVARRIRFDATGHAKRLPIIEPQ